MRKLPWTRRTVRTVIRDIAESLVCARRAVQRSNLIGRNNFSNADDFDHKWILPPLMFAPSGRTANTEHVQRNRDSKLLTPLH
jgi:hypothetical protein